MRGLIELPLEDTVDVHTAARMARVSTSTMRRWCEEGRLPACKPAGRWWVYRTELLLWINASRRPTAEEFRAAKQLTLTLESF